MFFCTVWHKFFRNLRNNTCSAKYKIPESRIDKRFSGINHIFNMSGRFSVTASGTQARGCKSVITPVDATIHVVIALVFIHDSFCLGKDGLHVLMLFYRSDSCRNGNTVNIVAVPFCRQLLQTRKAKLRLFYRLEKNDAELVAAYAENRIDTLKRSRQTFRGAS